MNLGIFRSIWRNPVIKPGKLPNMLAIGITAFWCLLIFISPHLASEGSLTDLDGRSNVIDNHEEFEGLGSTPRVVYSAGDILCHQKDSRSPEMNGNQLPFCTRCAAIYTAIPIGLLLTLFIPNSLDSRSYITSVLPKRYQPRLRKKIGPELGAFVVIFIFLLPTAIDGTLQLLTSYESISLLRILTGFPMGIIAGVLLGSIMNTSRDRDIQGQLIESHLLQKAREDKVG